MTLRSALLGSVSWAVMVGREHMRMMERRWAETTLRSGDVVTINGVKHHVR